MITRDNEEIVSDITLVSALLIANYKTTRRPQWIKSPNGKEQVLFFFEKSEALMKDIKAYNEKSDENELFAYFGALQDVKVQLIRDIKDKADKFVVIEDNGKFAMLSAELDNDTRDKLLKRFA